MILIIPLPQMFAIIIIASATIAKSQFCDALVTALPASERPIKMIIGPVTTGGKNLITFFTPTIFTISARIKYKSPATTIPPHAYGSFSPIVMSAKMPVSSAATAENPPKNANEEPKNAGTFILEHRWKNSVPRPAQISVT